MFLKGLEMPSLFQLVCRYVSSEQEDVTSDSILGIRHYHRF